MIRVNLLPHREEKRKRRQQQFIGILVFSLLLGLVAAGAVWFFLDQQVQQQQANVAYMKGEIGKLDKQIEEIRKIREETASLLAKKQVVEGLQSNRSEPVQLLDQLLRQLPEGIYLKAIKQAGVKVNVIGYAQSNARVSTLMRNIEASPWVNAPELVEIKLVPVPGQPGGRQPAAGADRINEFTLNMQVKRDMPPLDGKPAAAKPPAPAPAAAPPKAAAPAKASLAEGVHG